jgi:cell division protein FtsL
MSEQVDSTSDERTVNNVMRHQYRVLSDQEKAHMQRAKDAGLEFVRLLHEIGGTSASERVDGEEARQASRQLSVAQTKVEEAVMWAVKHITK